MYQGFVNKEPLLRPTDTTDALYAEKLKMYEVQEAFFQDLQQEFIDSNYNLKTVIKAILLSRYFREANLSDTITFDEATLLTDVGMEKPLTPEQLDRKIEHLMGRHWGRYDDEHLLTQEWRFKLLYGGINSNTITDRIRETNGVMAAVQQRMANEMSCMMVPYEFTFLTQENRKLLKYITMEMEPETDSGVAIQANQTAIKQNIQHLVQRLWGESLAVDDPEIVRIYNLFMDVWRDGKRGLSTGEYSGDLPWRCNVYVFPQEIWSTVPWNQRVTWDPNYIVRSWVAVLTYLLIDYQFLYE